MKKFIPLITIITCICSIQNLHAQTIGDYRTQFPGNWKNTAIWQMYNGVTWGPAVVPPSNLSGAITVRDSIEVTDTVYADQITVDNGKVIYVKGRLVVMNGPGTDIQSNGRLAVAASGQINNDTLVGGSTIEYKAPFLNTAGGISPDITFSSSQTQTINGPGYFGYITVNNSNNIVVNGAQGYSGVKFLKGRIIVAGTFLISQYNQGFTGQSASRFIDGDVLCILYDTSRITFTLPVGKNGHYSPIVLTLKQDNSVQTEVLVSPRDTAPALRILPGTLDRVSTVRFVHIDRLPSASNLIFASLKLSYDSTDGVSDPTNLRIARGNADAWQNMGGVGTAPVKGTISFSTTSPAKGDYVLANATGGGNVLPLKFISFTASPVKQAVQLNWATAQEVNTSHFTIERMGGGSITWQAIGRVTANTQSAANTYTYLDQGVNNNSVYWYRLQEADKDGSLFTSKTIQVRTGKVGKMEVSLMYPNPAKDVLHYTVTAGNNDAVTISIINNNGVTELAQKTTAGQVQNLYLQKLPAGTYYFTAINETTHEKVVKKFVRL